MDNEVGEVGLELAGGPEFVGGVLLTTSGLLGIWVQGLFYERGFPTPATFEKVRMMFTLPAAVTTLGSMVVAGVLFGSTLTTSWSLSKRLVIFICFGVIVILGCTVCGHLATARIAKILN